jgi:hypothetical protein
MKTVKRIWNSLFFCSILILSTNYLQANSRHLNENGLRSWSGLRMMILGSHYLIDVPRDAQNWIKTEESSYFSKLAEEEKNAISSSMLKGFRNVGKLLVLMGAAEEYKRIFDYQSDPNNPLNSLSPKDREEAQLNRLKTIQSFLNDLECTLGGESMDSSWVTSLFDAKTNTLTQASLRLGLNAVGSFLQNVNLYGIGIEVVGDLPLGSLVANVMGKMLPQKLLNAGRRVNYQQVKGLLYLLKENEIPTLRGESRFAATTFSQSSLRAQGTMLTQGQGNRATNLTVTVRLSLFASTETLSNFQIENLGSVVVSELGTTNNALNSLPPKMRGIATRIQTAVDKGSHTDFLKQNIKLAMGHLDAGAGPNGELLAPNLLLRFSMGNYSKSLSKTPANNGFFEFSGSLGSLSVSPDLR